MLFLMIGNNVFVDNLKIIVIIVDVIVIVVRYLIFIFLDKVYFLILLKNFFKKICMIEYNMIKFDKSIMILFR